MTFLVSKLMNFFLVVLQSFLEIFCSVSQFFLSLKDLDFKYLFLYASFFCHEKCLICLNIFPILTGAYLLKTERIVSLKLYISFLSNLPVFFIRLIFIIINFFYKCRSYYLRFKLLKFHFEFCYCQQMKIRNASLKIITMLKVTGFVCKY